MDPILFTVTNIFTGWSVNVYDRGDCYTVEQYDVDCAYMGSMTFTSEAGAIRHAILMS